MSWHVEGTYFENCNCDFECPCTITPGQPATGDRCTFLVAFKYFGEQGERGACTVFSPPHPLNDTAHVGKADSGGKGTFRPWFQHGSKARLLGPFCLARLGFPPPLWWVLTAEGSRLPFGL